jgi:hypothetical protein
MSLASAHLAGELQSGRKVVFGGAMQSVVEFCGPRQCCQRSLQHFVAVFLKAACRFDQLRLGEELRAYFLMAKPPLEREYSTRERCSHKMWEVKDKSSSKIAASFLHKLLYSRG